MFITDLSQIYLPALLISACFLGIALVLLIISRILRGKLSQATTRSGIYLIAFAAVYLLHTALLTLVFATGIVGWIIPERGNQATEHPVIFALGAMAFLAAIMGILIGYVFFGVVVAKFLTRKIKPRTN